MNNTIDKYINNKNENLAIYTKKESKNQDIYEHISEEILWMDIDLDDSDLNIIEFIDSHEEGLYEGIKSLIELVKRGETKAVLAHDFKDIPLELGISLVEECEKRDVHLYMYF